MQSARQWIPYCGEAPGPLDWLGRWNADPVLIAMLAVAALSLWLPGSPLLAGRSGRQRGALRCAWGLTVLLYVSPLCALSSTFFTVRVLHHLALVFALAPLLVFGLQSPCPQGRPLRLWTWTALAAATFWAWHAPGPYAAALSSDGVYAVMQFSLLFSAMGFWGAVRRARPGEAMLAVLASTVLMGLLGALITFAARPLYAPHFASTLSWGVAPLEDQQLAGVLMWAPGSIAYLLAAVAIGWAWMRSARAGLPQGQSA